METPAKLLDFLGSENARRDCGNHSVQTWDFYSATLNRQRILLLHYPADDNVPVFPKAFY